MSREQLNEDAQRILGDMGDEVAEHEAGESLVEEWSVDFYRKALEYGTMHRVLGLRAQFVDIHRKVGKLERAWWMDADTTDWREQPREIAMDLIGHLFLAVAMIDREAGAGSSNDGEAYAPPWASQAGHEEILKTDAMRGIHPANFEITLGGSRIKENCGNNSYQADMQCQRAEGHDGWHSNRGEDGQTYSWHS